MLRPVRRDAGLGDPPAQFTTNDTESGNFMIKYELSFDVKKPHEFINAVKEQIKIQFRNADRAIFGSGPFQVRAGFEHFKVDGNKWVTLNAHQRLAKTKLFQEAGMSAKKDDITKTQLDRASSPLVGSPHLSITAEESGIDNIPLPILNTMFVKANNILSNDDWVFKRPGVNDEWVGVAGVHL